MAWTHASGQLNPDGDKIIKFFKQNSQNPNSVSILIVSPSFTSERLQIKYFPVWQDLVHPASSILIEPSYFNLRYQKFPDRRATKSAAHEFKFGALENLQAHMASLTAPYQNEAAYQAYLKRVLNVSSNNG